MSDPVPPEQSRRFRSTLESRYALVHAEQLRTDASTERRKNTEGARCRDEAGDHAKTSRSGDQGGCNTCSSLQGRFCCGYSFNDCHRDSPPSFIAQGRAGVRPVERIAFRASQDAGHLISDLPAKIDRSSWLRCHSSLVFEIAFAI
jgi:hypothetical protein